jgi:hypothetical protein
VYSFRFLFHGFSHEDVCPVSLPSSSRFYRLLPLQPHAPGWNIYYILLYIFAVNLCLGLSFKSAPISISPIHNHLILTLLTLYSTPPPNLLVEYFHEKMNTDFLTLPLNPSPESCLTCFHCRAVGFTLTHIGFHSIFLHQDHLNRCVGVRAIGFTPCRDRVCSFGMRNICRWSDLRALGLSRVCMRTEI